MASFLVLRRTLHCGRNGVLVSNLGMPEVTDVRGMAPIRKTLPGYLALNSFYSPLLGA